MPDSRKNLYDALSNDFDLGTFEEFNSKMDIPESRKKLYESVSVDFDLGTFDEFETKVGTLKKKEPTYPGLKDAFGMSLRGPLMEKSNLQVTTKKEKQPLKSNLKAEELKSIETNLAKENIELSQIKQKLTALEKSGKLQDPTIQAEYNGLVGQYNEKQKAVKGQFDKYHKEHGNYRTIVRDEQNADLKKGINTAKGVLNKINTYDATLKQVGLRYGQTKVALEEAMQAGDNDAAAQLQGQLKKDEAIIANLGELIKTGKKVAAGQEQDSFGNNINIGIYQAFGTILQSPQGLTKAALTPIMEYGMGLDPVQRELMFRTLAQLNPNMMASETLAEFGGEISTKAEGRKQMANMNRLYGGSSYNALMKGDILNAVSYAAKDFANSLPSSTLYATGAGAALMSAGMVGDEIRRTEEETGQAIGSKEILTASVKAGLEVVTERMFGDGKAAVELVKRLGKAGAEKAISDAVKEIARKGLGRKIAEQAGEEVVGESLNQIGANAADIYINGKKDINLWDGVGDAALIALVGGGAYGGALTTASHYIDKARIKEAEDLKSQAANYMEQSMMQQNPAAAEVLEEKANTLNLEAQNIVDKEQEIALNANPETVDAIIALEGLKEQLEEALQEEGLPEEVSVVIEEKLSALQVEHNDLIVQATKEAQENIKAEEEEISEPIDVTEFLKGDTKEEDLTRPSVEVVEAPKEIPQAGSVGVGVEAKRKETEAKIKRKDLFIGVGEFSSELGGSDKAAVPVSHKEKNGIEFVQYAHPETGSVDVIVTGKSDNDFVGFYRIYENGKPTNKWSSKFENQSRNKEDFKTMIGGVQEMLPQGHEYTEKSSISTDGLRVWEQQLSRGYELQYDKNGKLITNLVAINGDAIVNELGIPVQKGEFENIKVKSKEEFEIVKKALLPYLEKLGLGENDIRWLTGTVKINLPVLKSTKATPQAGSVGVGGDVKPLEGYHYTDKDFTEFEQPTETQSLGNGTYFYLNKRKSTKREVTSELNVKKVLDWKELKDEERSTIIKELEKAKIPTDRLNDGKLVRKAFNNIDDAKKFSSDKKAEGLNVKTDLVDGKYIVEYKEKGLSSASNDKLRGLAAEFDPNIAKRLGYDAAKLGDEIVVFDVKNTKIKPVEQSLKETPKAGSVGVGGEPYLVDSVFIEKINPDGENTALTERQEGSIDKAVQMAIDAGQTAEQIAGTLNALGYAFINPLGMQAAQQTLINYIKNRINGTDTRNINEFAKNTKAVENKYEYDPKAKDSSRDIGSRADDSRAKKSDITAGTNKGESSENVSVPTKEEVVQEEPTKEEVKVEENPALKDVDESLVKEREIAKNNLNKLEYNIPNSTGKIRLNEDGSFKDAGDYYDGKWDSLNRYGENNQAMKNALEQDYPKVKKLFDKDKQLNDALNSKLADDLNTLKNKLGGLKQLKEAFENYSFEQIGSSSKLESGIASFIKSGLQFDKIEGISKAVEELLTNKKETPASESKVEETPALKNVESTTKALEKISNDKFTQAEQENTPTARDVNYGDITWQKSGISSFNIASNGKTYITDKDGEIYQIIKHKLKQNDNYFITIRDKDGNDVGNFEFEKNKDGSYSANESYVTKRRKGLASIAYDYLSEDGILIKPSKKLKIDGIKFWSKSISEAYHKAKQDGSNPELVKAVEELLTNKQQEDAVKEGNKSESNLGERKGVTEQQQGEQEDRTNKEEPISQPEGEAGSGNQSKQSRESKTKEVKSKLTPDQAVSNLEGLKVKEKAPEPKVKVIKPRKFNPYKSLKKLDPQVEEDFIALKLAGLRITKRSFLRVMGPAFLTPQINMVYLTSNLGVDISDVANDLILKEPMFENFDEKQLIQLIADFIIDNPAGPNAYAKEKLDTPDPEQVRYQQELEEVEQMLSEEKEAREAELDAIDTAWSQLENEIETLSEEDIDKILSLMAEDDIENINNIIESNNEKQDVGGEKDGGVVVSENEGSQKDNQGKSKEELEAKVKEKKSAVDKAQNALSKAKANLEKAVSESQRNIFGKAEAESKLFAPDLKALNKFISDKESILALAKESLQKANDELNSWTPKNQTKISFDDTITLLEKLKVDTKNKSFDAVLGIPIGIWNASIDTITLAVKAGVSISDAIKRGLNYIQKNHRGAWDKKGFNQKVLEELGLRGIEVNGEDLIVKPVEKEFASVVNGFYSDIEQSLLDTNKDNLSGKEWISTLGNSDEANWTGLTNWLNSQEGKVSKANIRAFLKDNKIEVVEVVKSDESYKEPKQLYQVLDENGYDVLGESVDKITADEIVSENEGYSIEEIYNENSLRRETKFSQYQLEGESENYKEVLVTMPPKKRVGVKYEVRELGNGFSVWNNVSNSFESLVGVISKNEAQERVTKANEIGQDSTYDRNDVFQSSHFDEPNILVHLRMNTRVDSEGNKVLFLEEVQSDWGQQGKKEGFFEKPKMFEAKDVKSIKQEGLLWIIDFGAEYEEVGLRVSNFPTKESAIKEAVKKLNDENDTLRGNVGGSFQTPPAPFVTDTNAWTKLGLKVALKEAVKQGADKIAWTTGEQQNARYDLRKQVDSINYLKNADGTYQVYGKKGDNIVFKEKALAENKLEASFGKDVAEKIINDKGDSKEGLATKVLEGENLAVGGKGMKGFYGSPTERAKATSLKVERVGDKFKVGSIEFKNENEAKKYIDEYGLGIVGNVAKSLFKQEPGTTKITIDNVSDIQVYENNKGRWFVDAKESDGMRSQKSFDTEAEANKYAKSLPTDGTTQNSIDITPELKASVEGGLPLFGNVIQALERLKLDTKGKLNAFGIAPALWNAGIDTIILAIKGGTELAEAVQRGVEYFKEKGAKFDEAKVTALLEEKVGLKRTQPKENNEKDNTEEPLLEGVQADRDEAKTGQDGPELRTDSKEKGERKIRRHFLTILNNASLKEATKFMLENDFAYNVKSMERSLSRAKAYLEKNGMEDSYNNFITYGTQIEGLTGDESIALAFLMQTIINEAVVREVKAGNQEVADELYDEFYRLSEKLSVIGTESGRVVNAFNLFLLDMSNPISAQMALNRIARKAENKAKASDSKERKKAESKTKAVKSEVDKGKRKASREVAEFAEDITKEDSELGDIIFKGSKKPISDEMKAKISDFFDSMKSKPKKSLASNNIQRPILWDPFVDSVKKSVIEDNTPLPKAIAKAYSELASTSDKKTLDSVRDAFVKEAGVSPEQVAKKIQAQKKKESERLQKEKDTLEKELQKERDRVAKLRAKEKESQQARIDEQSAKLQLQEAKEAQKAVEDKIEKDRTEKQKTLTQAKKEALKNELAAAKQKAKDAQKVLDLADKMALKTIQAELKEAQNKEKQLEKDIDKLGKELVRNRLFEDLVADLVDEYINMKGDTKNEDLIKLVEERLGVKGEKAVKIANKIRSSVYNNVTKRVSDRFERDIETEKKRLYGPEIVEAYEKMTGDEATKDKELLKLIEEKLKLTGEKANQVAKKVKEGTYGKKEPKSGEQIVDELVFAINSKMMTADMMMDLFPSKYGMVNFTAEDFQKVRELSQAIATAPSSERKAIAIKNFLEYLYSFKPYYFAELMNELWYFDVLSGVLTIGLQTGDVNNFYNFVQASAMAKEVPIVSALQSVRRAFEDKKIDYGVSALKDVLTGFTKGLIQTMVRPTANEVKTASAWIKFAFKNKAFLNESRSAFVESFLNGTASFTDFDNPFKNSALGEFDIQRVWDGAKKNKSEGKKGLAYLYWLAMESVYNVGAAAYRFITPFVNKIVPQVGKTLAAQDLFFTGIIKNTYSPFVLREQLRKEGLRGAELEAELAKRLYITEEELASARYTATNWRMKYDIGFSQNEKGEWNIYDNGKEVKKFSLGRFKTMNFATLEEAEDYARTVVAPSGSRYRLDVISQLNLKRGMEALKAEKRIASFNLLTKASMGYTGTLLSALNSASNWLTKQSETISESASLKDSRAMRYGLNILATSVLYATHLFSFLKVGTGLARMFSQYYTPIGLARAVRADLQNKSLLGKELDENISKTEIDMLYAKALLGLIPTYFAAGMAQRLAELIKDDEDKDKEEKEVELTAQEKKFLELIEKKNGIKLTNEQKKVLTLVKPGDVVGNLQWMEAGMRRFYTNNKILVESSEFKGYDEQGNRMWSSLSAYPNYILAESIATAAWYMYFNKDNKESNPVTQFVLNPLYKFIDLSIGQGIVKYFASKTSTENKLEALAQTIVFDQLGVFNPNLLSGVMKYVDGKARKNENIFDYIDNQEDGSYPTAIGAYTLDKVVPLKGAWYEATQAPIVYGQFGEEIFRVPAEKQGYISAAIGYYKNKDKNPEQKAMNEFFLSIGINKLYVPDKSPIIDENFKPHKLTPRQRDEYGMLAGRVSFSQFKKLTPLIQEVYSKVSEKAAGDMVNKVFVSNYKNMAAFKLGLITQKEFDRLSTENIASVIVKAVKSMNQSVLSEDVLEALEVTKEEKDFMENMKKVSGEDNKRAIFLKQMNQLKDETEMSDYLVRMYQLKIMSENMFNELYNYKYLNGTIGANIPERIEEEENQEEEEN